MPVIAKVLLVMHNLKKDSNVLKRNDYLIGIAGLGAKLKKIAGL